MGLGYFTPKEILENKDLIKDALLNESSYFIRSGILGSLLVKNIPHESQILEIGSGGGQFGKFLLDRGYKNLTLSDIDDYIMPEVKARTSFFMADISFTKLPLHDSLIDLVLAITIFEHLENPFFAIQEITRVLRKNGKLIIAIPYIFSLRSKFKFFLRGDLSGYTETNNHVSLFTRALFKKVFLKHYIIKETYYSPGFIKVLGKKIKFPLFLGFLNKYFGNDVMYILEKK